MRSTKVETSRVPGEILGEDFAGGVRVDLGMDAQAGADVAGIGEGAQDDVKTLGSFFDGCFGEARVLEEATRNGAVAGCVEGGRRVGLVGSDGRVWFERCAAAACPFHTLPG